MGMLGSILQGAGQIFGTAWAQDKAEGMQHSAQAFSNEQLKYQQDFQREMSNTAYQRSTADLKAAGLNPMLAYHQGGASSPPGGATGGPGGGAVNRPDMAAAMQSAASVDLMERQAENVQAQTDREKATADEIRARTPTHAVTIDRMRQEINESIERIQDIQQRVRTGASSAAHLDQQVRNLQAGIPQIQAATRQLNTLATLNEAQAVERLTASGLNEAHAKEIYQRIKQDLPALQRQLMELERVAEEMQQPGRMADEAAKSSFVGQLGAYIKALLPIQGIMGALPLGRFTGPARPQGPNRTPAERNYYGTQR